MDLTLNVGTTINSGFAPFVTTIKSEFGVVILAAANDAVPDADMSIAGADCANEGFVTAKANVYIVPDDRVDPV